MRLQPRGNLLDRYAIESAHCEWDLLRGMRACIRLSPIHDEIEAGVGALQHIAESLGSAVVLSDVSAGSAKQDPIDIQGIARRLNIDDRTGVLELEIVDPLAAICGRPSHAVLSSTDVGSVLRAVLGPEIELEFVDGSDIIEVPTCLVNGLSVQDVLAHVCRIHGLITSWSGKTARVARISAANGVPLDLGMDANGELAVRLRPHATRIVECPMSESYEAAESEISSAEVCSGLVQQTLDRCNALVPGAVNARLGSRTPWEAGLLADVVPDEGLMVFTGIANRLVLPGSAVALKARDGSKFELVVESMSFEYSSRGGSTGPVRLRAVDPLSLRSICSQVPETRESSIAVVQEIQSTDCQVSVSFPWDGEQVLVPLVELPLRDAGPGQGTWKRPIPGSVAVVSWEGLGEGLRLERFLPLPDLFFQEEESMSDIDDTMAGVVRVGEDLYLRGPQSDDKGTMVRLGAKDLAILLDGEEIVRVDSGGLHLRFEGSSIHVERSSVFATGENEVEISTNAGAKVALRGASTNVNDGAIEVD